MRYMCLIFGNETASGPDMLPEYEKFTKDVQDAGLLRGGDALQPSSTATTVRVRNDETVTTDGPFAETKEQLGGYYELDCKDLDEAILWASKIPGAKTGCVEIRPIREFA